MITPFTVYNAAGEILRSGTCPADLLALQTGPGELVTEQPGNDLTQWVDVWDIPGTGPLPMVIDKESLPFVVNKTEVQADGVDTVVISGLPIPAVVTVDSTRYEVADGVLEIDFDAAKVYRIRIEAFPCLPAELEVTAL